MESESETGKTTGRAIEIEIARKSASASEASATKRAKLWPPDAEAPEAEAPPEAPQPETS